MKVEGKCSVRWSFLEIIKLHIMCIMSYISPSFSSPTDLPDRFLPCREELRTCNGSSMTTDLKQWTWRLWRVEGSR